MGAELPPQAIVSGAFLADAHGVASVVRSRNLLFIGEQGPLPEAGVLPRGKLGQAFDVEAGRRLARSAAEALLARVQDTLGSLDGVQQLVELRAVLNTTADFDAHDEVVDAASALLHEALGERGVHVRSVTGAHSLRGGLPLLLAATVAVRPET